MNDSLLCTEIFNNYAPLNNSGLNHISYTGFSSNTNEMTLNNSASSGIPDLENIYLDTPPDFQLAVSFTFFYSFSTFMHLISIRFPA